MNHKSEIDFIHTFIHCCTTATNLPVPTLSASFAIHEDKLRQVFFLTKSFDHIVRVQVVELQPRKINNQIDNHIEHISSYPLLSLYIHSLLDKPCNHLDHPDTPYRKNRRIDRSNQCRQKELSDWK